MQSIAQKEGLVKEVFCAIDLHDRSMLAGIAFDRGKASFKEFMTDEDGVLELIELLGEIRERHPGSRVWVAYEASGCGFRLADDLSDHGFMVSVLAPGNLPQTVRSRSSKTDKRDAIRILEVLRGHVLAGNSLPAVWIPSLQIRDDREIVRRRLALRERGADTKNAILGFLRRYGLRKPAGMKSNWTKRHVAWLKSLPAGLDAGAAIHLSSLLRELAFYLEESARLDAELVRLAGEERHAPRVEALTAMKGVGLLTALVFLVELGELGRFENRRALGNYLGLTPRSWESGEDADRKGRISKLGPGRIRKVLNQAAWSAVRHDRAWHDWFGERTVAGKGQGKRKGKMIVAVMRRLAIRMWHAGLAAS